jgi:hypothetical protein
MSAKIVASCGKSAQDFAASAKRSLSRRTGLALQGLLLEHAQNAPPWFAEPAEFLRN